MLDKATNADATLTVRMTCDVDTDDGGQYREGCAYSVPFRIAQLLVANGYAELIRESGPQEHKTPQECNDA